MKPKVIIQILHFNNINDTLDCLKSVFSLSYPNFRILVVDNRGFEVNPESELELLKNQGRIELIRSHKNLGFTGGHNVGFNYSLKNNADYVWILNNDTVVTKNSLCKLITDIEQDISIAAISPVIYHHESNSIQYLASIKDPQDKEFVYTKSIKEYQTWINNGNNIYLWGTALLIRSSALIDIGFFYNELFAYYEDTDFCNRIFAKNYRTSVCIDTKIFHKRELDDNTSLRKPHFYFYMSRNHYLISKKKSRSYMFLNTFRLSFLNSLELLSICLKNNNTECANAVLDGFYCGCINYGGPWKHNIKMPKILGYICKRYTWPIYRILTLFKNK
jgi:GT2 family glycosyltransferase